MIRHFLLWVTLIFLSQTTFGQREINITVPEPEENALNLLEVFSKNENNLLYTWSMNKSTKNWALSMLSYSSRPASKKEVQQLKERGIDVSESLNFKRWTSENRAQLKESVSFSAFIKVNGEIRRITELVSAENENFVHIAKNRDFKAHSALQPGSGDWYKVKVTKNGIYSIDYEFLQAAGIDVENLNPNHINIFGNGYGLLPESNNVERPDDLIKNAITIEGGNDGSFDPGDKILFYGRGPHRWERSGSYGFQRQINYYAEYSAYFININANETPSRITNALTTNATPNQTVNSFNDFARHESESTNLLKGGKRWYGEKFDVELSQNFSFSFPNLISTAPANVGYALAYNTGDNQSNFTLNYNGNTFSTTTFNPLVGSTTLFGRKVVSVINGGFLPQSGNITINCALNRNNPSIYAYLDYLEVNVRRELKVEENQLDFRDVNSVGTGNVSNFQIENFSNNHKVWEITDYNNPGLVNGQLNNNTFDFTVNTDTLRDFICFNTSYLEPTFSGRIENQDLHGLAYADYLLITPSQFMGQANRLAALHEAEGLSVHVVDVKKIYNEFSGGAPDVTAIRYFAKMFFERSNGNSDLMPKYMCLFGDGTYDPKNRVETNNNMILTYQADNSEDVIDNLVSDDYYGLLGDNESFSSNDDLDIGIGRIIISNDLQARQMVDKIEHYIKNGSTLFANSSSNTDASGYSSTQGDWRLSYTLIADDKDKTGDTFLTSDTEPAYYSVEASNPEMNANKIYLDALQQITTAGGERYPQANEMIDRNFAKGSVVMAYIGHGGESGAAQERIITINQINALTNIDRLTLFVSATCEFTKYDDNKNVSAGEHMYLNPTGGAIALMTTTRSVYINVNTATNTAFFNNVFLRNADNSPKAFGDIIRNTKNQASGNNNKRSFTLIGDPGVKIALPQHNIVIDSINGYALNNYADTLKALSKARVSGHIEDQFGNPLNYNGVVINTIYDKVKDYITLGNDLATPTNYELQKNKLYNGKSTVTNGQFSYEFIVPKDINYNIDFGKSSDYFYNDNNSAGGANKQFYVGGIDVNGISDDIGPEITLYLNDDSFVNGGISDETPIVIAELYDESGINTVGNGIGHNITVVIDEKTENLIVLNDFYEADLDTYKSGELNYQLNELEPGRHTLTFKAWDVNNNSSEKTIEFYVQEKEDIALKHVLNYPNPFTTSTEFYFEHNQANAAMETQIEVFTVSGILVKTINKTVNTNGFRTEGIHWDGLDEFGDQLAKGLYIYKVKVKTADGKEASALQKLYLLR